MSDPISFTHEQTTMAMEIKTINDRCFNLNYQIQTMSTRLADMLLKITTRDPSILDDIDNKMMCENQKLSFEIENCQVTRG